MDDSGEVREGLGVGEDGKFRRGGEWVVVGENCIDGKGVVDL